MPRESSSLTSFEERASQYRMKITVALAAQVAKLCFVGVKCLLITNKHVMLHRLKVGVHVVAMDAIWAQTSGNDPTPPLRGNAVAKLPIRRRRKTRIESAG